MTICVLGAGSWGTALAVHASRLGRPTRLWGRDLDRMETMQRTRVSTRYLEGQALPPGLELTSNLDEALGEASLVIWVVPSHAMRDMSRDVAPRLAERAQLGAISLVAAKGIEVDSLRPMAVVLHEELPAGFGERVAVLGGPSFAAEVAAGLPTTVVVGSDRPELAASVQGQLSADSFRVYTSDDLTGVELGGAMKNVIALAAGIGDGAGLGQNARAGVITRGLSEMRRLTTAMGAHPETLFGLAGVGDLVLTCTGGLSRNRRVGLALGEGRKLQEILEEMGMVAEGVRTTRSLYQLGAQQGVELPIVSVVHDILYGGREVKDAVRSLMQRDLRGERE